MGGKGGPLAFLNKKPWHPLNLRNQEEIWKREQAYLAELEKRDQLVKQIEEEREREDNVTQFQRHKLGDQRVEWMYQGGFAAQEDADKRREEYLLGKTVEKLPDQTGQEEAPARVDEVAQGASVAQPRTVEFTSNETWSRLNADPMLMMKRKELDKQKEIQEKIKMVRLQAKIQRKAAAQVNGAAKKEKKLKKDKKHKKEKRQKSSKRKRSSTDIESPSASQSPPPHNPAERPRPSDAPHSVAGDRGRNGACEHDPHPQRRNSCGADALAYADAHDGHGSSRGRGNTHRRDWDRDIHRAPRGDHDRRRGDGSAAGHRRSDSPERQDRRDRSRSPGRHRDRRHHDAGNRSRGRDREDRHWEQEPHRGQRVCEGEGDRRGLERRDQERGGERVERGSGGGSGHVREGYGLQDAHMPEYARSGVRDDSELTKRALADRAAEKERERAEERARAAAARKKHRVGKITAEEREARRAAMADAAADLGGARMRMLQRVHDEDTAVTAAERKDTEEYLRSEEKRTLLASRAINI